MSNLLPRALLADVASALTAGDVASALMLLGSESGPEASAAVSSYRALCAVHLGELTTAERHLRVALDLVERRQRESVPENAELLEKALRGLPAAEVPFSPALEVISPAMTTVRLRRQLAALLIRAGREAEASMELALLPQSARKL